jgi:hypothetical protein
LAACLAFDNVCLSVAVLHVQLKEMHRNGQITHSQSFISNIYRLGKIKPQTSIFTVACRCTNIQFVQACSIHLKPMNGRLDHAAMKHCP